MHPEKVWLPVLAFNDGEWLADIDALIPEPDLDRPAPSAVETEALEAMMRDDGD